MSSQKEIYCPVLKVKEKWVRIKFLFGGSMVILDWRLERRESGQVGRDGSHPLHDLFDGLPFFGSSVAKNGHLQRQEYSTDILELPADQGRHPEKGESQNAGG
jgi:hypothetical protein